MNHMGKTKRMVGRENFLTMTSGPYIYLFPSFLSWEYCSFRVAFSVNSPTSSDIWTQAGSRPGGPELNCELCFFLLSMVLRGSGSLLPIILGIPSSEWKLPSLIFLFLPQRRQCSLPGHKTWSSLMGLDLGSQICMHTEISQAGNVIGNRECWGL